MSADGSTTTGQPVEPDPDGQERREPVGHGGDPLDVGDPYDGDRTTGSGYVVNGPDGPLDVGGP